MPEYVFKPPPMASVAVSGVEARFPVRRIVCVGRNYAAHAREMGRDPDREAPFFFVKPANAAVDGGGTVPYPPLTENFHYEIELVVAIGTGGADIAPDDALGVWSRDEVTRVKFEDVGRCRPGMADGFEGVLHRSALRCLARL